MNGTPIRSQYNYHLGDIVRGICFGVAACILSLDPKSSTEKNSCISLAKCPTMEFIIRLMIGCLISPLSIVLSCAVYFSKKLRELMFFQVGFKTLQGIVLVLIQFTTSGRELTPGSPFTLALLFGLTITRKPKILSQCFRLAIGLISITLQSSQEYKDYIVLALTSLDCCIDFIGMLAASFKIKKKQEAAEQKGKKVRAKPNINVSPPQIFQKVDLAKDKFVNIELSQTDLAKSSNYCLDKIDADFTKSNLTIQQGSFQKLIAKPEPPSTHIPIYKAPDAELTVPKSPMRRDLPKLVYSLLKEPLPNNTQIEISDSKAQENNSPILLVDKLFNKLDKTPKGLGQTLNRKFATLGDPQQGVQKENSISSSKASSLARSEIRHSKTSHKNPFELRRVASAQPSVQTANVSDMEIDKKSRKSSRPNSQYAPLQAFSSRMESEYLSLTDQVIVACDRQLNVLTNNYQERFYERIVLPAKEFINVNKIRVKQGVKIDKFFYDNANDLLRVDQKTIELMTTFIEEYNFEQNKDNISKIFPSRHGMKVVSFLLNTNRKIKKVIQNTPKVRMYFEQKRQDLTNPDLVDCEFSIVDLCGFLRETMQVSTNTGFINPVLLKFYIGSCIQMRISIILGTECYMFLVLENIEEKIKMGELNTKLNYSYMLICSLSHELFTPINHLVGSSEILKDSLLAIPSISAKIKEDSTLLYQSSQTLTYFLQNILDFARFINKTLTLSIESFNLKQEIANFMDLFTIKIKRKKLKLEWICEDVEVHTDKYKLLGLLFIFIDNSIKYTNKGFIKLLVKRGRSPRFIRFEVHDSGTGIGEDDLLKLSEILKNPFDDIRTTGAAGLGIGMRIAQILLIYLSNGEMVVDIQSTKGMGTQICFEVLKKSSPIDKDGINTICKRLTTRNAMLQDSMLITDPKNVNAAEISEDEKFESVEEIKVIVDVMPPSVSVEQTDRNSYKDEEIPRALAKDLGLFYNPPVSPDPILIPKFMGKSVPNKTTSNSIHMRSYTLKQVDHSPKQTLMQDKTVIIQQSDIQRSAIQRSAIQLALNTKVAVVVDDEVLNADFLQSWLESLGYKVYIAYNGELALELFNKLLTFNTVVEVIFMDYSMPVMSGDECVQRLRTQKFDPILKNCRIIGLTAHRDNDVKRACLNAGMDIVDYKPYTFSSTKNILLKLGLISESTDNRGKGG